MSNDKISIDLRDSGKYRYRVWDSTAKRYESASFTRTEEDAKRDKPGTAAGDRWAKNQLARYQLGQSTAEPAAIGPVVAAYLGQLGQGRPAERPLHPTHVADVTRTLNGLATAYPSLDLNKAIPAKATLRQWLANLKARHLNDDGVVIRRNLTLSPRTKLRYLIHVKAMIGWAVAEGIIARDPIGNLTVEQNDKVIKPVFKLEQIRQFLKLRRPDSAPWLWVTIMLYQGLRRSEALALTWADILWDQKLIKVCLGKGRKARLVPLQDELREILMPLGGPKAKTPRIGRVIVGDEFTGHNRRYEWFVFRKILEDAEIEADIGLDPITKRMARLHPHSCRHTYGGLMLASGYDSMLLRQAMGHEQSETTGDYSQSATMFRSEIEAEGWKPGELRLKSGKAAAKTG